MTEAELNKTRLALALEAAGLDLWENNLVTGEITRRAIKTFASLGYSAEEMAPFVHETLLLVHPEDAPRVMDAMQAHLAGQTSQYRCEFRLRAKTGEWIWFANYGKVMDGTSELPGERFVGVTFNIDDRKRREKEIEDINRELAEKNALLETYNRQLETMASTDALTGLANRRRMMELGINECRRTERFRHALSLLMIDIDLFKSINDGYGHSTGDDVICSVADICRNRVRQGVDSVARLGGEEFVVLLPETPLSEACALAESLRERIAASPITTAEAATPVRFTVSIGVAAHAGDAMSFEQLLNHADKALYRAKHSGRNQVQCYAP